MTKRFSASVDDFILKSQKRMDATFRTALQDVSEQATLPKGHGGRMPIDTGFLVNSFTGAIGHMPSGPSDPGTDGMGSPEDIALTIARANVGDTVYLGFTARYARVQEAKNSFVEAAAQKWPSIVRKAAAEAKRRYR